MSNEYAVPVVEVSTRHCFVCGETGNVTVPLSAYLAWKRGSYIQDAMAEMPAGFREQLISGTHPACWNTIYERAPARPPSPHRPEEDSP